MKFLLKPAALAVATVALMGCQQEAAKKEETVVAAPVLDTQEQKQAYALGASVGNYLSRNLEAQEEFGIKLDKEILVQGFMESIEGKSSIEKEEIQSLLMALDASVKEKQQAKLKADAEASLAEGKKFLEDNAKKEGVVVTESGLQYEVLTTAEGEKPAATDTVKVHYHGTFLNGDVFDSSVDRGEPATFPLNRVIKGWTEGVQLMAVGSKFKFTVPSDLAYGPNGNPPRIPGNSVLVFEVELLEIQKAEEPVSVGQ